MGSTTYCQPNTRFHANARPHDEEGKRLAREDAAAHGFAALEVGLEARREDLRAAVAYRDEDASLVMRYMPDFLFSSKRCNFFGDVKTESGTYPNFTVEFDSWRVAGLLDPGCIYAFADLSTYRVRWCCHADVPTARVRLPDHDDADRFEKRIRRTLPSTKIERRYGEGGAGTPYFLVAKTSPFLKSAEEFFPALGRLTIN